jgi:hypothetical protein
MTLWYSRVPGIALEEPMTRTMELTVTQKLRLFLARSGQPVAPWSSVEEVMDRLYGLLYARREQAGLWEDLAALLDSIQSETRTMLAAPDAEILIQSRVDRLVAELGRAVRASAETPSVGAMRRFAVGKSASVLACIALLAAGFSVGCGSSNSSANSEGDAATPLLDVRRADEPISRPVADVTPNSPRDAAPLSPDTAASSPKDVESPDLPASGPRDGTEFLVDAASAEVGEALDGSSADSMSLPSGDALMDLFRDGTPADIAARLEASVDQPIDIPRGVPIYKGVCFPEDAA